MFLGIEHTLESRAGQETRDRPDTEPGSCQEDSEQPPTSCRQLQHHAEHRNVVGGGGVGGGGVTLFSRHQGGASSRSLPDLKRGKTKKRLSLIIIVIL